jgi:uncharacterized membrane protein
MPRNKIEKIAIAFTRWIGSPSSIFLHTALFAATIMLLVSGIFSFDKVILIFNTAVSLEAIYLALFIQMTVNFQAESIEEVAEDIEEVQEDIGEIQEDIEEVQEDVDELQEDVEDISEDVEEISEDEKQDEVQKREQKGALDAIKIDLQKLLADVERLKNE